MGYIAALVAVHHSSSLFHPSSIHCTVATTVQLLLATLLMLKSAARARNTASMQMQERMSSFASYIKIYGERDHLVQNHENWKVFLYTNFMLSICPQLHACIHHVSVIVQNLTVGTLKCYEYSGTDKHITRSALYGIRNSSHQPGFACCRIAVGVSESRSTVLSYHSFLSHPYVLKFMLLLVLLKVFVVI